METKVLPDIKIAEAEFEDLQKLQQVLFFSLTAMIILIIMLCLHHWNILHLSILVWYPYSCSTQNS